MKKIITIITLLLVIVSNVQAERRVGTVDAIDLEAGLIKIDNVQYKVQPSKIKLMSEKHKLKLSLLEEGNKVSFVTNYKDITGIRLTTPYVFND